jgi:hypothetical protein
MIIVVKCTVMVVVTQLQKRHPAPPVVAKTTVVIWNGSVLIGAILIIP